MVHNFNINRTDADLIETILQRFEKLAGGVGRERAGLYMDMVACHNGACPLDLEAMAKGRDLDLAHDVAGIYRHYDRETGELTGYFSPRFAKRG